MREVLPPVSRPYYPVFWSSQCADERGPPSCFSSLLPSFLIVPVCWWERSSLLFLVPITQFSDRPSVLKREVLPPVSRPYYPVFWSSQCADERGPPSCFCSIFHSFLIVPVCWWERSSPPVSAPYSTVFWSSQCVDERGPLLLFLLHIPQFSDRTSVLMREVLSSCFCSIFHSFLIVPVCWWERSSLLFLVPITQLAPGWTLP